MIRGRLRGGRNKKDLVVFFFDLVDTLQNDWNTAHEWILKWYPLIKNQQIAQADG